jgi:Protein of unknown function (DUF3102)
LYVFTQFMVSNQVSLFSYTGAVVAKIKSTLSYALVIPMPASNSLSPKQRFDYTILEPEAYQVVKVQTGEIRALMKLSFESIVQIGQKLKLVKQHLGHGHFRTWLESEFDWSIWTATKFMQVAERFEETNFSGLDIAPSALYELAAPSTPEAARDEALARAASGESISYTTAKALRQKYIPQATKTKAEAVTGLALGLKQTVALPPSSGSKLEIVAIRPAAPTVLPSSDTSRLTPPHLPQLPPAPQPTSPISVDEEPGALWQLGGRHLLYGGDPNSAQFLQRVPEKVSLMFGFPPTLDWYSTIRAKTRIITDEYLPQGKDVRLLEDMLETSILLYSKVGELVVSCFVPSVEILSIINRQDRRALIAEPDSKRVNAVISDWKLAGLKVERLA